MQANPAPLKLVDTVLPLPTARAPRIRSAGSGDLLALAAVRRESWWSTYRDIVPEAELRGMDDRRTAQRMSSALGVPMHGILVVEDDRRPLGYAWLGPHRHGVGHHRGEILELYLHPSAQGRGLGRQLLVSSIWWLVDRGLHPVMVWVLAANPARHFYEACGGVRAGQGPVRIGGITLPRVAYSWRDALPLPL